MSLNNDDQAHKDLLLQHWTDDPALEEDLLQQYGERIEKLSQQD